VKKTELENTIAVNEGETYTIDPEYAAAEREYEAYKDIF
jgi:hypothetical protein